MLFKPDIMFEAFVMWKSVMLDVLRSVAHHAASPELVLDQMLFQTAAAQDGPRPELGCGEVQE